MRHIPYMIGLLLVVMLAAVLMTPSSAPLAQTFFPTATPIGFDPAFGFPTFTPVPTPTPPLTPAPTSDAPGCANPLPLQVGNVITLRSGINIRALASASAPWLRNFPENRQFTVTGGPVCADDFIWWQIQGHGLSGWVAERNQTMTFILGVDPITAAPACTPPLRLAAGQTIDLVTGVRIRQEPNLRGLVLTVAPMDSTATILSDETVCADGYNWRQVRVTVVNFTYDGWMVEGSRAIPDQYYVDVTPVVSECYPPFALRMGQLARVGYRDSTPKNLRTAPGMDSEVLFTLVRGIPLEIIGGPVCADGLNYWRVRVLGTTPVEGWLAEGTMANRWIRPFVDTERRYP